MVDAYLKGDLMSDLESIITLKELPTRWLKFYTYIFLPFKILTSPVIIFAQYNQLIVTGHKTFLNPVDFIPIVIFDIFILLGCYLTKKCARGIMVMG